MSSNTVEIKFTAKDLTKGAWNSLTGGIRSVGKQIFSLKGLIAGGSVGLMAKQFLDASNTSEQLRVRLGVLLGSVQEGNQLFKDMSSYASKVPFQYEEIMKSATTLSGVLKGGRQEIGQWMPLIGDLAASTGLSIQETTEQVQRMLSAGAASADKFRERGVLAMLGFQSGVSYSAAETKKMLVEAWESPVSKFHGATGKLATTWDGILSMMSDKWFQFRNAFMDSGVFNYLKALATAVNDWLGKAMQGAGGSVAAWGKLTVEVMRNALTALGWIMDGIRGLQAAWIGFKLLMAAGAESIVGTLLEIANGFRTVANLIPGVDIGPLTGMEYLLSSMRDRTGELSGEFEKLINTPMPSTAVQSFANDVESIFQDLKLKSIELKKAMPGADPEENAATQQIMMEDVATRYGILDESLLSEMERQQLHNAQQLAELDAAYAGRSQSDAGYIAKREAIELKHHQNMSKYQHDHLKGAFGFAQAMRKKEYDAALANGVLMLSQAKDLGGGIFRLWKGVALAQAIVDLRSSVVASWRNAGGYPLGIVPAAIMAAKGALEIRRIQSASLGQAHGGLTSAPDDQTIMVKRGERITLQDQNRDLTDFLASWKSGGYDGGQSITVQGGLNVNIPIDAHDLISMSPGQVQELVAEKIIPALNVLSDQGIRQKDFSRGQQR